MKIGDLVKWGQTAKNWFDFHEDEDTNKIGIVVDSKVDKINPSADSQCEVFWSDSKVEWINCQWLLDAHTGVRYV